MPDAYTDNFDLILPEPGGSTDTWGDKLNENFSRIDTLIAGRASAEAIILTSSDDLFALPNESRFYAVAGDKPANYPEGAHAYSELVYLTRNNDRNNAIVLVDSNGDMYWTASSSDTFLAWRKGWNTRNMGAGSGLDADLLDGQQGSSYVRNNNGDQSINGNLSLTKGVVLADGFINTDGAMYYNPSQGFRVKDQDSWGMLWHSSNDGSGSGLDADRLDGQHGSYYRDAGNLNTGKVPSARIPDDVLRTFGSQTLSGDLRIDSSNSTPSFIVSRTNNNINANIELRTVDKSITIGQGDTSWFNVGSGTDLRWKSDGVFRVGSTSGDVEWKGVATGDGSGISSVDADKVDGLHASSFVRNDNGDQTVNGGLTANGGIALGGDYIDTDGAMYYNPSQGFRVQDQDSWGTLWHSSNDGSGSGLDADRLDGQHGSYYRDAGNLNTGTLSTSRLGTGSSERNWALARVADGSVGSVGTYALLFNQTGAVLQPGDTVSGSNLLYTSARGYSGGLSDTHPSGTWRCMGYANDNGAASTQERVTMFLRIS